ncbi:DUF1667 domain-containing protein [Eubacteriales bacterium OttesenSCG-928-N13]|nr:DUF1667 domain-containing protein [Eubacteriales bacterium OttesenSCG-928-N13]
MKSTEMTCILCPMGCRLMVTQDGDKIRVEGNSCARGQKYGVQELTNPERVVTSSIRVMGGQMPLCPVKTKGQVPKSSIDEVLHAIRASKAIAPVKLGQVLLANVAGTGVDIVATANRNAV